MKKLVVLVLVVVCLQFSYSQTNPQYRYKIDLKTKFKDKHDLKPLKHGLKALIERSRFFENKEFGENYSLWIIAPQVSKTLLPDGSKKVIYTCLLELRTPAAFSNGDYIDSREIYIEYTIDKEELEKLKDPNNNNIGKFIAGLGEKMTDPKQRGTISNIVSGTLAVFTGSGSAIVEVGINQICVAFSNYFTSGDPLDYKAEYFIVGGELYNKLTEMIVELENNNK